MGEHRVIRLSILAATLLLCVACSDPRDYDATKLTEEQKKELGQKLTADEGQKLTGWMLRQAFTGQKPAIGVTVRNAIKDQEQWTAKVKAEEELAAIKRKQEEAKAAELRKKVEAERRAAEEQFAKMLSVALTGKRNQAGEYGKRFVYLHIAYENKTDKDIEGVKGVLHISDMFGDKIINVRWSYDRGVAANKTAVETGSGLEINQFMDPHMKLWNTEFDKIKSSFEVQTIIFKDGTRVDAPPAL
jgi:hypothetical protein